MQHMSILDDLAASHPDTEIWWDSSPLLFDGWAESVVASAGRERRARVRAQVERLFDPRAERASLISGSTTNPTLIHQAICAAPQRFAEYVRALRRARMDMTAEDLSRALYREVGRQSAARLLPMWRASNGARGWVSVQVHPGAIFDRGAMLDDATAIARLSPNIMVKLPGTAAGISALATLTERGVATNMTLTFSVPQLVAYLNAIEAGRQKALSRDDLKAPWRSVFTFMSSRFGERGELRAQAAALGLSLDETEVRLAEVLVLRRMHRVHQAFQSPTKLLICSLRIDRQPSPRSSLSLHIERTAGLPLVYTCPPAFLESLLAYEGPLARRIPDEEAPGDADLVEKLLCLSYFREAYDLDGMAPHAFDSHPALLRSAADVAASAQETLRFVHDCVGAPSEAVAPMLAS